jgi:hypothetical protein
LELAYAITVHKAQGGEARQVVLALSSQHGRMLTRRLLYTGLTRAREQLVVVATDCEPDPLARATKRAEADSRLTWLTDRIRTAAESRGLPLHERIEFSNELSAAAETGTVAESDEKMVTSSGDDPSDDPSVLGSLGAELLMDNLQRLPRVLFDAGIGSGLAHQVARSAESVLREGTLVSGDDLRRSLEELGEAGTARMAAARVLEEAPRLLVTSSGHVQRSIKFCRDRLLLGSLGNAASSAPSAQEGLVEQLRCLLAKATSSKD